jgi:hypothetical protein
MKVYIDQSGKIEQTGVPTVIAFSNGKKGSVIISAKNKKQLLEIYRSFQKSTVRYTLQVFSSLIFLLIKEFGLYKEVIFIDREYVGYEGEIKSYISQLVKKEKPKLSIDLHFCLIGKRNNAHQTAISALRKNRADFRINSREVLKLINMYKKGRKAK